MTEEIMRLWNIYETPEYEARACEVLYALLKERSEEDDPNINISHRALPAWDEHVDYIHRRPANVWYLILVGERFVGYVSATKRNEIGIVLFRSERGKGYGRRALELFLHTARPLPAVPGERNGSFVANINPLNSRSIRLFRSMGATLLQHTYRMPQE